MVPKFGRPSTSTAERVRDFDILRLGARIWEEGYEIEERKVEGKSWSEYWMRPRAEDRIAAGICLGRATNPAVTFLMKEKLFLFAHEWAFEPTSFSFVGASAMGTMRGLRAASVGLRTTNAPDRGHIPPGACR
jgi:hypothetical protein